MKESEVIDEVTRLFEAFPSASATDATAERYCSELVDLPYATALHDAVTSLIRSEDWRPSISKVRDEYGRHHGKHAPKALRPPDLTEEEESENMRRVAVLTDHFAGGEGHDATLFAECSHPDCQQFASEAAELEAKGEL